MVRLAQDFSQRSPLVEGQGNFGNIDGDSAAAMRYTEARLTEVALLMLEGIDEDAVDFRPTYDGSEKNEPVVLPAAFPNCWRTAPTASPAWRPASRRTTSRNCADALRYLITTPNAGIEKLVGFIPTDFPTGGELVESRESIIESYRTGKGSFRLARQMAQRGTEARHMANRRDRNSLIRCKKIPPDRENGRTAASAQTAPARRRERRIRR